MGTLTPELGGKMEACTFCQEKLLSDFSFKVVNGQVQLSDSDKSKLLPFSVAPILHYLRTQLEGKVAVTENVLAWLCPSCLLMASRLTDLCRELEISQMKVDHAVKEMVDLISQPHSSNHVKTEKDTGLTLREETKTLAIAALAKPRQLKVKLNRIRMDRTSLPVPALTSTRQTDKQDEQTKGYQCPICETGFTKRKALVAHSQYSHPEQAFMAARLPGISEEDFSALCKEHIQQKSENRLYTGAFKCPECPMAYKGKRSQLVVHLIKSHHDAISKNLMKLQSAKEIKTMDMEPQIVVTEENEQEMLQEIIRNIPKAVVSKEEGNSSVNVCGVCSQEDSSAYVVTTQRGLINHMFTSHPEFFFACEYNSFYRESPAGFKKNCIQLLQEHTVQSKKIRHLASKKCLLKYCSICQSSFYESRKLRQHLINKHFSLLCKKLGNLIQSSAATNDKDEKTDKKMEEKNVTYKCQLCERSFKSPKALGGHVSSTHKCDNPGTNHARPKCSHCGTTFHSKQNLRRHLRRNCASLKGNRSRQKLLMLTAQKEEKYVGNSKLATQGRKCRVCGLAFPNDFELSRHQKKNHPVIKRKDSKKKYQQRKVKCPKCDLEMLSKSLMRHITRKHSHLPQLLRTTGNPKGRETHSITKKQKYDKGNTHSNGLQIMAMNEGAVAVEEIVDSVQCKLEPEIAIEEDVFENDFGLGPGHPMNLYELEYAKYENSEASNNNHQGKNTGEQQWLNGYYSQQDSDSMY